MESGPPYYFTAKLQVQILSPGYPEKYAFLLLHCIGQNVQHGMGWVIMVLVLSEMMHFFCVDMHQKRCSHFHSHWPRPLTALPVIPHRDNFSSKYEHCMVLCFPVNGWYGTDGQMGCSEYCDRIIKQYNLPSICSFSSALFNSKSSCSFSMVYGMFSIIASCLCCSGVRWLTLSSSCCYKHNQNSDYKQ